MIVISKFRLHGLIRLHIFIYPKRPNLQAYKTSSAGTSTASLPQLQYQLHKRFCARLTKPRFEFSEKNVILENLVFNLIMY